MITPTPWGIYCLALFAFAGLGGVLGAFAELESRAPVLLCAAAFLFIAFLALTPVWLVWALVGFLVNG